MVHAGATRCRETERAFSTIIIAIISSPEVRFERLRKRTRITLSTTDEFTRLERDEEKVMDVGNLVEMADFVIQNDISNNAFLQKLQKEGRLLGFLLKTFIKRNKKER